MYLTLQLHGHRCQDGLARFARLEGLLDDEGGAAGHVHLGGAQKFGLVILKKKQ